MVTPPFKPQTLNHVINAAILLGCILLVSFNTENFLAATFLTFFYGMSIVIEFYAEGFTLETFRKRFYDIVFIVLIIYHRNSLLVMVQLLLIRQFFFYITTLALLIKNKGVMKAIINNPYLITILSFFLAAVIAAIILMLPISSASGEITPFINAIFTSTSAICVTGLIVVDTATYFSLFGQIVILICIQLGGIGIMTFSSAFLLFTGKKLNLELRVSSSDILGETDEVNLINLIKNIVKTTLIIEGIAAFFMVVFFILDGMPVEKAVYFSIFHSISAFCNAGFSTFTDSLVNVPGGPMITFVISLLFLLGGIGFPVLHLLSGPNKSLREKVRGLLNNEHASLVIKVSIILITGGTILLFFTEFNHSMTNFTIPSRVFHAYFQSVTARTAGFNSVDMTHIGTGSAVIFIVLMFIGASPGSTGGGVKTTTFGILVLSIFSLVKGNANVIYKRRSVPADLFIKAAGLAFISLAGISACIFILTLTEPFSVAQIAFEAVSAFGTVGLSLGITPQLSYVGKIVIIFMMFAGRVGPLSFIMVMKKRFAEVETRFPKGNWIIG